MTRSRDFVDADLARRLLETPDEDRSEPGAELRQRLLDTVGPERRFAGFVPRVATMLDLSVERVEALLAHVGEVTHDRWEDGITPGVRLLHFDGGPRVEAAHCGLVHVPAGTHYPGHRHLGDEWAFVLQGASEEDDGRVLHPGDLMRLPAGSAHSFRALGDEPFVFVVVLHEGIEFLDDDGGPSTPR